MTCFNPQPLRRTAATSSHLATSKRFQLFQSSAAPKNGCYFLIAHQDTDSSKGFNPQPLRRTAATRCTSTNRMIISLFQSSAAPKNGCYEMYFDEQDDHIPVSILSRSEERLLLGGIDTPEIRTRFQSSAAPKNGCYENPGVTVAGDNVFQSSAAPKNGCYADKSTEALTARCFNPQPLRRTAATSAVRSIVGDVLDVSILSRSEERLLLLGVQRWYGEQLDGFNPQPLRRTAATRPLQHRSLTRQCFNPQPLRRTAAT